MLRFAVSAMLALLSCSVVAGLPPSSKAPKAGDAAPSFTLPDADGEERSLSSLLATAGAGKPGWIMLIFYRGHW